jgi:hypothetical protein
MIAEEILEKHLLLMLKRTDESYVSVDEMKKQPEWQATINAMLEYSEMQALRIHDVVWRSEPCCLLHSTDWNGKCFKCGEQVFVREPK